MWLLDTASLRLYRFYEKDVPTYAILSHRWTENEASFKHMSDAHLIGPVATDLEENYIVAELQKYHQKKLEALDGWHKVFNFCHMARGLGYQYAWIDTCCIDQSSSAELSESINSMYKWYRQADVCIVYMNDVQAEEPGVIPVESFKQSKWFTRGWTLQELLAPTNILFVDCLWRTLGKHTDLVDMISDVTKIDRVVITRSNSSLKGISVAKKMFWASCRETTREEDMAYCLLGLFQVNMPLLYGEGLKQAFLRLQIEIMKTTHDETIFVWNPLRHSRTTAGPTSLFIGLLAESPSCFAHSVGEEFSIYFAAWGFARLYQQVSHGLRIHLQLFKQEDLDMELPVFNRLSRFEPMDVFLTPLQCVGPDGYICICIVQLSSPTSASEKWCRRVGDWFKIPFEAFISPSREKVQRSEVLILSDSLFNQIIDILPYDTSLTDDGIKVGPWM